MEEQAKKQFLEFLAHHQPPKANYLFELEKNDLDSAEGWKLTATPEGLYHTAFLLFRLLMESPAHAEKVALWEKELPRTNGKPWVFFVPMAKKSAHADGLPKEGNLDMNRVLGVIATIVAFCVFLVGVFQSIAWVRNWWGF